MASSFSGFTADHFKNWINLFSLMVLRDILPSEHLQCLHYFVLTSRILCQMIITDAEINLVNAFLLQLCCRVERLYGKEEITPNMHLHCHLKESLLDYGLVHNFWLFPYERYNGILENYPSSHHVFEIMQSFVKEFQLYSSSLYLPEELYSDFGELFKKNFEPSGFIKGHDAWRII